MKGGSPAVKVMESLDNAQVEAASSRWNSGNPGLPPLAQTTSI